MELRQDRMSGKERLDALFNYQKPDRVPIHGMSLGFSTKNVGYTVANAYDDPEKNFDAQLWTAEQYGWELAPLFFGHTILGGWDFGGEIQMPDSEYQGSLLIKSTPVKTEDDVWNLKMPNPKTDGGIPKAMDFAKIEEKNGIPISFVARMPFTMASNICGFEQFARWMIKKPELCHRLLRMATDHIFNVLQYWVDTFGAEKIWFAPNSPSASNQMISPKQLEQFALPYYEEVLRMLRITGIKRFWFHICGEQNLNLPCLAQLASSWPHPSILSFGHEVDLEVAARYFPYDIIYGNVEPAVIQSGTPQEVYELTTIAIEKGRKAPGGFILGPGCELPVMSPPANVWAITKAINDFGWYE